MEKKYVLAVDQSTQGTKAILFNQSGELVCRSVLSHKQWINELGWVSHDLDEIYENTIRVVKDVVGKAAIRKEEIACLGITNQRETSAAWSRREQLPLAPAIVWQCSRAQEICERIRQNVVIEPSREQGEEGSVADIIQSKTGMHLSAYFPAAKFAWLLENVEAVKKAKREKNLCLGTIDSYLLYRLTKGSVYATDYSNASRTQLFNIHILEWDTEICNWFGIQPSILPKVCDSSASYGMTDMEGYFETPIPICGVVGDSQGALFGQGCIQKGMVKATYGTGSSVMMNVGKDPVLSDQGLVTSLAWGIDHEVNYVLEGNINYTGAVITWLKDDMKLIDSIQETSELAAKANPKDTTYLVPAFSGLGAPYWKADAKAVCWGMSRTTRKPEIVKAALESIAYQITDVALLMEAEGMQVKKLCVDGGPTGNSYLMQFQSDILGVAVDLAKCQESSAQGAALLAGLEYGIYTPKQIFDKKAGKEYQPLMDQDERALRYQGWKQAVSKVL